MVKGRRARRHARAPHQPAPAATAALPRRTPTAPAPPAEQTPEPLPAELEPPPGRRVTLEELTGGKDDATLTAELADRLRQIPVCDHCGGRHARACPRIRKMSFHANGALAAVEFWPAGKWSDDNVIWPEDLNED